MLTAALICNLETNAVVNLPAFKAEPQQALLRTASRSPQPYQYRSKMVVKQWRKEKEGERGSAATECRVYTPNNRCRPAPLTSLPKLTPVKNVEEDRRVGGGGERKNNTR